MDSKKILMMAAVFAAAMFGAAIMMESEESDAATSYSLEASDLMNCANRNWFVESGTYVYIADSIETEGGITVKYTPDVRSFTITSSNPEKTVVITKTNRSSGAVLDTRDIYWEYNSNGYTWNLGIRYYANGGSNAPANQLYANQPSNLMEVTLRTSEPTPPTGAIFLGWSESQTATSPDYYPGDSFINYSEGLANLYAVYETQTIYTFNLVYNANGGSNAPATQSWSGTATSYVFTVSSTTPRPPTGSTFYGWNTDQQSDWPAYVAGDTISVTISGGSTTATVTLYAIYDIPTYTVRINVNDPSYGTVSPSILYNVPKYTYLNFGNNEMQVGSTTVTVTKNPGYSWGYWSNNISGTHQPVWVESDITFTANLTGSLYTVFFDNEFSPEGSVSPSVIRNVPYGSPITINENTITINGTTVTATPDPGYSFKWWSVPGGTVPTTVTEDLRFTAYFTDERTFNLYYNMNGGSPQIPSSSSIRPSTATSETFTVSWTIPTKAGYIFQGWCASPAATVVDYDPGDQITVTWASGGSQTLYAVWEDGNFHVFNLYYNMMGGSPQLDTQTFQGSASTTSHTFTIPSTIPTKEGYDFLGWSINSSASSADYSPGNRIAVYWDVQSSTGDRTLYAVWEEQEVPVVLDGVYWSNNLYNGSVTLACRFTGGNMNATHQITIPLYEGIMMENNQPAWNLTGYELRISVSYPNTIIVVTLTNNGSPVSGFPVTANVGKWSGFELKIDAEKGDMSFTPMNRFNNFTSYTTYSEREQIIADWSEQTSNNAIYRILHKDEGAGAPMSFQVVNTMTFLDTFGVVMTNPSINVHDYFPDYEKVRLNFYSFALYGDSFTINGKTFPVVDGSVTVYYFTDVSKMNHWLPSIDSPTPTDPYGEQYVAKSKTMMLSNIYVTWNGDTCSLTFVNDKFTVDLGTYSAGDESVSFTGFWYFTTTLFEPVTVTEKSIDGSSWKDLPDIGGPAMILLYLGILLGLGLIAHAKLGLKWLDLTVLAIGMVLGFTLLG